MRENVFPFVISLKDGKPETLINFENFISLVEKHMGYDAAQWLREYMTELANECDYTKKRIEYELDNYAETLHSNEVAFESINEELESITSTLADVRMDRKKIAHAVREIGKIITNQF